MQENFNATTISLAGIVQAVSLMKELAQTGKMNEKAYQASIYSIFQTNPDDIIQVYNGLDGIQLGLDKLIHLFSLRSDTNRSLMRYILSLIHLQKKISRSPKLLQQLTQRINQIKKQVDYFHLTHPTVIANLADAYMTTISSFHFRIIIWGSQRSLSVNANMDKIRALLLAGIRSAVLWRQMGGSRLQLLLSRGKMKSAAEKILVNLETALTNRIDS